MDIKSLTDTPGKLPTIPKVTQKLIESFGSADVSVGEIAALITADPALSAKLLWLANSAYFHVSNTIGTVDDALRMLGFVMVRNMVLGNGLASAFRNTPGMDLKQFWRYNLYTACASRWLATHLGTNSDMAFTLGLMHGIGQLQLHAVAPAAMTPLDQQLNVLDAKRHGLETTALGFHYGDVSAALAGVWNFPTPIVNALGNIPDPLSAAEFSTPAGCVHIAAWLARTEVLASNDKEIEASYPSAVGLRLGLPPVWAPALMPPLKDLTQGLEDLLA
jgi:HD-like signal output (HDOD) protein